MAKATTTDRGQMVEEMVDRGTIGKGARGMGARYAGPRQTVKRPHNRGHVIGSTWPWLTGQPPKKLSNFLWMWRSTRGGGGQGEGGRGYTGGLTVENGLCE